MTEQRPVATVLGNELDLRLWNYRDFTPLGGGQVDDEPYGGGAGHGAPRRRRRTLRSRRSTAIPASRRIVALTPQGRQLDQELVEELAGEEALTLLSARFEGFDERIVEHIATDSVSIGPYVLSGGELPAMVLVDAVARRLPGAIREESGAVETFSAELEGGVEFPQYTRPPEFDGWTGPGRPPLGRPRAHRDVAQGAEQRANAFVRGPIDRLTTGLPAPWPTVIDWVVTIVVAVGAVLAIKAWIVNPYRIPSSSMEPTLHCAEPQPGCLASYSDRVLANRFIYHFRDPHRGDIVVFDTPAKALEACGAGGTFVKRIIGLPGDTVEERNGTVLINGERLDEPYVPASERDKRTDSWKVPEGSYFMMGDNRSQSCDSREWGSVPREDLIGPVFSVYWPPQRICVSLAWCVGPRGRLFL